MKRVIIIRARNHSRTYAASIIGKVAEECRALARAAILGASIKSVAKSRSNHLDEMQKAQLYKAMQDEAMLHLSRSFALASISTGELRDTLSKIPIPKYMKEKKHGWRRPYKYHP